MVVQNEIINTLKFLAKKFSSYTFRYWIDKIDGDHIIEVEPPTFEESEAFINYEIDFLNDFYAKYQSQTLSFLKSSEVMFREDLQLISTFNLPTWLGISRMLPKSMPNSTNLIDKYSPVSDTFLNTAA